MIHSKYIHDIVDLLLDCDPEGLLARQQIPYLSEANYNYTGAGLFVTFKHSDGIEKFRTQEDKLVLNGVKVQSDLPSIEAEAMMFFKDGLIDYLEIWCYDGKYPHDDLINTH